MTYKLIKTIEINEYQVIPKGIVFEDRGRYYEGINPYTKRPIRISHEELATWGGEYFQPYERTKQPTK